jgi:hypothetical protein
MGAVILPVHSSYLRLERVLYHSLSLYALLVFSLTKSSLFGVVVLVVAYSRRCTLVIRPWSLMTALTALMHHRS